MARNGKITFEIGMEVNANIAYIMLSLSENGNNVNCGADYDGTPEELTAMIAYVVKNISADMHVSPERLICDVQDVIRIMREEEKARATRED